MATLHRHSARPNDTVRSDEAICADETTCADGNAQPRPGRADRRGTGRRRSVSAPPRHVAYALALAAVSMLAVGNSLAGGSNAATAAPEVSESAAVAHALGLDSSAAVTSPMEERELLGQLSASRAQRDAEQAAAIASQVQAEQAAAAALAAAEVRAAAAAAAVEAAAAEAAAAATEAAATPAPAASTATTAIAKINNSAGPVRPQAQAAANAVVSNVPGADSITIGGTRGSASDPGGHPSGLALDYMVMSDAALGDAIVDYHIAHWDSLGVDYIIWQQRRLSSPGGSWSTMENRGSATANHMDHPHVNYRG